MSQTVVDLVFCYGCQAPLLWYTIGTGIKFTINVVEVKFPLSHISVWRGVGLMKFQRAIESAKTRES